MLYLLRFMQHFYSNGKFLITGEYLVTKGARALAVPLQFGQSLEIIPTSDNHQITWKSYERENLWFEGVFSLSDFQIVSSSHNEIAENLRKMLFTIRSLNPTFLTESTGLDVISKANFTMTWGLGSSSTLINNLATWGNINPYFLLDKTFGGSGYDIACADNDFPIFYTKKDVENIEIEKAEFHPSFHKNIFFVYLGKKMNSRTGMAHFDKNAQFDQKIIEKIEEIGQQLTICTDLSTFEALLLEHEQIISETIGLERTQDALFADYPHVIKSLGAWGGDFVMVTGNNLEEVQNYFNANNLTTIFTYKNIVLNA